MVAAPAIALLLAIQSPGADSLRSLAQALPDSDLVVRAKAAPLVLREAVSRDMEAGDLASAARLASAYAAAWSDSFLVQEVARFAGWSPALRSARLQADSVRKAGVAAFSREGARAAITVWRRALARATRIPDTTLMAATLGNIGAGFLREGELDSAQAYFTRAATLAAANGDQRVQANAFTGLGAVSERGAEPAGARHYYLQALRLHDRMGDRRGQAAVLNNLGLLARSVGDLTEARRQFEAALALNREDGRDESAATNLVNLAALATLDGDFPTAQRQYREALEIWRERGAWADAADALQGLGQLELRRGDYPAGIEVLTDALELYQRTGPIESEVRVRRALAEALAAEGRLQDALDALREAEDRSAPGLPVEVQAGLVLARADLAFEFNALAQAEGLYGRAERMYREAGDDEGEAEARHGRGMLLLAGGNLAGAEAQFEASLRVQLAMGNRRGAGLSRLALGQVSRDRGDTTAARRRLARAAADLEQAGDPVGVAATLAELGGLEADRGHPIAAEARYRTALTWLEGRISPDLKWELYAGLAQARRARGAPDLAVDAFHLAIAEVEQAGRTLALPERRAGFLANKWEAYTQLALLEGSRGRWAAAFDVSEQLRAREMIDLLGRGRIDRPAGAAPELVAREQDLRRHIARLTGELETGGGGPLRGPTPVVEDGVLREALLAAQGAYTELLLDMRERAPRHTELVAREPAGWREVASGLRSGEALIEFLVSDSGSLGFVVRADTLAVRNLGISRGELARLVAFARGTVESPHSASDSAWRGPFRRLYRHLIAPLEEAGLLDGVTRLILVPHAELHYLPFAALLGDDGPLVNRYVITTTPSATAWLLLGDRQRKARGHGVLAVAPRPDALPASRREVEALTRFVPGGVQELIGVDATEGAFLQAAAGKRILHLATFGVLNQANPLFSFVEFAPGDTQDGRLEVHEVFGLNLPADLVVLSACQTALGSGRRADVPPGDDWVGLTRAFLHAGARSVVGTLWAVDDRATADLMEAFYRELGSDTSPAQALAKGQRALLAMPATAHPFSWSGVLVVEGRTP